MAALERVWACDTITGNRLNVIPVADFSWARAFNGKSDGSATIKVQDPDVKKLDLPGLIVERATTLVYEVGGQVRAAGVVGDTDYDKDTGTLTVPHSDIWKILEDRLVIKHGAANIKTEKLVYGPLSKGTIAKGIVQEAVAPGGWYGLPIVFPADVAGTETRTYYGYQMQEVQDALKELMESDGGPDIDFVPQWGASGSLEWVMRAAPGLTSPGVWEHNLDAAKPTAVNVRARTDTSQFTNNAFVTGEGTEKNVLYRSNPSADHSRPAAENAAAFKGVTSDGVLGQLAVERSRVLSVPTRQYSASVLKDNSAGLALGDTVRLYAAADPWLPKGWSTHRLIKFSGSLAQKISLEFQPTGA